MYVGIFKDIKSINFVYKEIAIDLKKKKNDMKTHFSLEIVIKKQKTALYPDDIFTYTSRFR